MTGDVAVLREVGQEIVAVLASLFAGTFWEARVKGHVRENINPCGARNRLIGEVAETIIDLRIGCRHLRYPILKRADPLDFPRGSDGGHGWD